MTGVLADLADQIAAVNKANGWYAAERSFGDDIALLHSEVSEAYEEYRNGHAPGERYYAYADGSRAHASHSAKGQPYKPEGIPSELADVLIRVLDTAYRYGIDLDAVVAEKLVHNATRGHKHGGKIV